MTQDNGNTTTIQIEADPSNGTTPDREKYKRIIALELEPAAIDAPDTVTVELEERGEQVAISFEPTSPHCTANNLSTVVWDTL